MLSPTAAIRNHAIGENWQHSASGLFVPPGVGKRRHDLPVGLDLFSGAGGFSCGFHQAGWHVAAAVEHDVDASMTYLTNLARPGVKIHVDPEHPVIGPNAPRTKKSKRKGAVPFDAHIGSGWISTRPDDPGCEHFYVYDVKHLTGERILGDLGMEVGELDCVFGGPPCQGFSIAGRRDVMDPRNSLVFEFARLVCEIRPKAFVMENVTGILNMRTPEGMPVLDALAAYMSGRGYSDYEALRQALGGAPNARAGVRDSMSGKRTKKNEDREPVDDGQDALFEVDA
ncbi:DNA cytosine methyltransferase [Mycobacteroides abscessus subsp. abscessus]|uniref:DNA cytosine methyltransferase n=1 Tax=Mycobacteroides abscessus TaxID=36809 RepID=UPI00266DA9EA|nr:DNA cytosine methyltransferase [Mycobacteroides abscessus]MDO3168233.1 DNA cytosine methyltransferase [Mycobacteroides abscessus subsp. abscessus]